MASAPLFISIIPAYYNRMDDLVKLVTKRYRKCGIRNYALSMSLHPQGSRILHKVELQSSFFQELKQKLESLPIRLGILFQSTLGHGGYWNMLTDCSLPGQHIINEDGSQNHRYCPMEPEFQEYLFQAVKTVTENRPDFLLGDDDMRMSQSCFCPRHLAEFSRRMKINYTRESLVKELKEAPPYSHISTEFRKLQLDTIQFMARTIRKAIDEVDPSLSCGSCIVGSDADFALPTAQALAGNNPIPFIRINNGAYLEGPLKNSAWTNFRTGFQVLNLKKHGMPLLDESDTCPHNRFSKSARTMHQHITAGLIMGLNGGKLWFDQSIFPSREASAQYEKIFAEHRQFYAVIHELARTWIPAGVLTQIPDFKENPFPHHGEEFLQYKDWGTAMFGIMGIPYFYGDSQSEGIRTMAGHQVDCYSDTTLRSILSRKVILDSEAAFLLNQRGMTEYTGVTVRKGVIQGNQEYIDSLKIPCPFPAIDNAGCLMAISGAEILSRIRLFHVSKEEITDLMPGSIFYKNPHGGQIITMAMNLSGWHPMMLENPGRRRQLIEMLRKLEGPSIHLTAEQHCNLFTAHLPDRNDILAVTNYSYDPLPLSFADCRPPREVKRLHPDGSFKTVAFQYRNLRLTLNHRLEGGEIDLIKLIY